MHLQKRDELTARLRRINDEVRHDASVFAAVDAELGRPSHRLAVYGSLAPGESNHWVLAALPGRWEDGRVSGRLEQSGWGMTQGFPAMVWELDGNQIPVQVFTSPALPAHWDRIDAFEGSEYIRQLVPVDGLAGGTLVANIYALRDVPG